MRSWVVIISMVIAAGLSAAGLGPARERHHETALLALGLASLALWSGATLLVGLKAQRWLRSRKARRTEPDPSTKVLQASYTARYSLQDRLIATLLAAFFGWLAAFFASHAGSITAIAISGVFCCFAVCFAIDQLLTRVQFTMDRITSRTWWRNEVSEPYSNLRRVASKPGTVTLRFSDGQVIKLQPGLGDSDTVIAYLSKRAPRHVIHTHERH